VLRHDPQQLAATTDLELRRLVQSETTARVELGHLAKVFLARQRHHDLGFVRIGDYARERLGISTSEFYQLASVATALTSLPSIERSLTAGTICWTKARELAAVATLQSQEAWLAVAAQCTADELRSLIAHRRRSAAASSDSQSSASASQWSPTDDWSPGGEYERYTSPDDDDIDDEPAMTVVIGCPQSLRLLWWDVLRLSCQAAGSDLAPWQSAEIIAAEGLSESGWPEDPFRRPWPGGHTRRSSDVEDIAGTPAPQLCDRKARTQREHRVRMATRLDTSTAEQLDERMRAIVAAMQRIDADVGMLLCRVADERLHRRLGYDDFGAYCRNTLGISTRKARALVAIERTRRRTCSRITEAYRSGRISWLRCLVLLPVLTERTADAWIERAQRVTVRRLADEVMWSRMACDAGVLPEPMPPALGAPLEKDIRAFVQFRGSSAAGTSKRTKFGSVLLDAEIRFRAPGTVACLFRWAIFARRKPDEPVWVGLLRLLEHVSAFWRAAPKHRDPVFERDGWRCAVPACSSRRSLQDHHIVFRSQGGGGQRENRVAVCASHHQHGIHRGVLRTSGNAETGLDWEFGRRGGGGPWLRVSGRGEVYMPAES
jgi:hypothetical protein